MNTQNKLDEMTREALWGAERRKQKRIHTLLLCLIVVTNIVILIILTK